MSKSKKQMPTDELLKEYLEKGYSFIAGVDEAGKGAWAGPVVSSAVILDLNHSLKGLNDSKKLSAKKRDELYDQILAQAKAVGIGIIPAKQIDEMGLGEAHRESMRQAIQNLGINIDLALVDGSNISKLGVNSICIVKGDTKVNSIAAASIIAKVTRDRLMIKYSEQYKEYGFDSHKGYGTAKHQEALLNKGVVDIHRLSFDPVYRVWQGDLFSS